MRCWSVSLLLAGAWGYRSDTEGEAVLTLDSEVESKFLVGEGHEADDEGGGFDKCINQEEKHGTTCVRWSDTSRGARTLKTGDLLFFSDTKLKSKLQRAFSGKIVTHVGMVVWSLWDVEQQRYTYLPEYEPDAVLSLMEVSNHANDDIETSIRQDGFQNGNIYMKLQHQPPSTHIYIRPLNTKLDSEKLETLSSISSCLHARRPEYLKFFSTSESTIGKFWSAWMKNTEEEDEKYEYMFCSQFAALVIMAWDGPLQLGGPNGATPVAAEDADKEDLLFPGDFDPGDVKNIDNGMYGEMYELQIPYRQYAEYAAEADAQGELLKRSIARRSADLALDCKAGLPGIDYANKYLPTWTQELMEHIEEHTCDFKCNVDQVQIRANDGEEPLTFSIGERKGKDWRRENHCLADCKVALKRHNGKKVGSCKALGLSGVSDVKSGGNDYRLCCRALTECPRSEV